MDNFYSLISNKSWDSVMNDPDTQSSFTTFHSIFMSHYEKSFPFKPTPTRYKAKLPWLSQGLKKAINIKNRLYHKQLKRHTPHNITSYKTYRNKLNHLLRSVERQHYHILFETNKSNLRKSWAVINTIIRRNKVSKLKTDSLNINGTKCTSPSSIAEIFLIIILPT
jgi:hypothetical protein